MAATGATADPRGRLYARLVHRNRLVAVLRWAVPAAGALVLLVVIAGIVIASLSQRFGFSNISIDRDKLVVETPELISTVEDGTVYALGATAAKVSLIQSDIVDLTEATLTATTVAGQVTRATAAAAQLQTTDQLISVPGTTVVESYGWAQGHARHGVPRRHELDARRRRQGGHDAARRHAYPCRQHDLRT